MDALRYRTSEGDTVDYIAWRHYGATDRRIVETLLQANPGLADRGDVLPAGVLVTLPEVEPVQAKRGVKLWG